MDPISLDSPLNIANLEVLAKVTSRNIIVRDGDFQMVGKVGGFFARKTECRKVAEILLQDVRQKYGDAVYDSLKSDLSGIMAKGKPLSGRDIVYLQQEAKTRSEYITAQNKHMLDKFISGDPNRSDNRMNLTAVLNDYCARYGLDAEDPYLRNFLAGGVRKALQGSKHLLSLAEIRDAVLTADPIAAGNFAKASAFTQSREMDAVIRNVMAEQRLDPELKAECRAAVDRAVQYAVQHGDQPLTLASLSTLAEKAANAFAFKAGGAEEHSILGLRDRLELTPAQTDEVRKVVGLCVQQAMRDAALQKGGELSVDSLWNSVLDGSLPYLRNYLCSIGKAALHREEGMTEDQVKSKAEVLQRASISPARADVAMLVEQVEPFLLSASYYALEKLPAMRELQPEGILSPETIWRGCFGEPLPVELTGAGPKKLNDAIGGRLNEMISEAAGGDMNKLALGNLLITSGIKLEKVLEYARESPVSMTLNDFVTPHQLTPVNQLPDLLTAENYLADELPRRSGGCIVTFSKAALNGGSAETGRVDTKDTSQLTPESRQAYENKMRSAVSAELAGLAAELCRDENGRVNEMQLRQVVVSMGQSGSYLMRNTSAASGQPFLHEHSPVDINVRRERNGSITMNFVTPPDLPVSMNYTFTVDRNGQGILTSFRQDPVVEDSEEAWDEEGPAEA